MISEELLNINKALTGQVKELKSQVATHEKLLFLCLGMINNFGHFVPRAVDEFNAEFERIRGEERGHRERQSESDESQAPEELDE